MTESVKERINADVQKAKSEGKIRAERIQGIVREAFSQTIAEVKEGSGEIKATVKETFSKVLDTRKEGEEINQPNSSVNSKALVVFNTIKTRLFTRLFQNPIGLRHQYTKLRNQALSLDGNLAERYGDRYFAMKQYLENAATWYNTKTAQGKTIEPTVLQQQQTDIETKLGEAGTTFAQKEQQVKQQLKSLLKTAVAKL